jgi:proteasome lid subunit RPN8/RPN11
VNDEIQFGEVEQSAPQPALRPDENRHYAVVAYGQPRAAELPIFVDLDVLADMEGHAQSDTSVELGGVLLGGSYQDAEGRPFVVVTDSLRAAHYESTKGSFKFTHETWAAITREREAFPADLQMVGWYHTHPGWGVFLSGMDLFICDHFFNKSLDVAYVIDPCKGDRGMFQWSEGVERSIFRTGGFFVTASRFREAELEHYVAELSSAMPASMTSRPSTGGSTAPVVHLHQPRDDSPPWPAMALAGALVVQMLLVALIAWRMVSPPPATATGDDKLVTAIEKLNDSLTGMESRRRAELAEERARAKAELLDAAFQELKGTDAGAISRLAERFDETARLAADIEARDSEIREMRGLIGEARSKLQSLETSAKRDEKRLLSQIAELTEENGRLQADLKTRKAELASLHKNATAAEGDKKGESRFRSRTWWWVGGGVLAAIAVVGAVWWIGGPKAADTAEEPEKRPGEEKGS